MGAIFRRHLAGVPTTHAHPVGAASLAITPTPVVLPAAMNDATMAPAEVPATGRISVTDLAQRIDRADQIDALDATALSDAAGSLIPRAQQHSRGSMDLG